MDHDTFINDELVVDAVARNLDIIGEAARQLPEEYKRAHTEIPWTQIADCETELFTTTLDWIWKSSGRSSSTICRSSKTKSVLS